MTIHPSAQGDESSESHRGSCCLEDPLPHSLPWL